jgi:hypothetical protein
MLEHPDVVTDAVEGLLTRAERAIPASGRRRGRRRSA